MPLWDGYGEMLKSDIADMVNAPEGGMAGAVTAALFLRRFVPERGLWAPFDTFALPPAARTRSPKVGAAYGPPAAWALPSSLAGSSAHATGATHTFPGACPP